MKKLLQLIGITIASIIALVIVGAAVAVWCVFTPERLTPMVRQVADEYITCEWDMGDVDLTFFSTFPEFGLHIDGLYLVNPMKGAQSDTVLVAPSIVAKLDVVTYWQQHNLVIREISMPDIVANIYINADGANNLSVFKTTPDTTRQDSALVMPFDTLDIQSCTLSARVLSLKDEKDSLMATMCHTQLDVTIHTWDDVHINLQTTDATLQLKDVTYANNMSLSLDIPATVDLEKMHFQLHEAQITIQDMALSINGETTIGDSIAVDATVAMEDWGIQPVLNLLPAPIRSQLTDIDADGRLTLDAHAKGIYTKDCMPVVDAHVHIRDGQGKYAKLPYQFSGIRVDADAHLDLNNPQKTNVNIQHLYATTQQTSVQIQGQIADLLGEQSTTAHIDLDADLKDWAYFLPKHLVALGQVSGQVDADVRIADIVAQRMDRVKAQASLHVKDVKIQTDSLNAQLADGRLNADIQLKEWPIVHADLDLQSETLLTVHADTIDAQMLAPRIMANASFNVKDSASIPTFSTTIQFKDFKGNYSQYTAHLGTSQIEAKMSSARRDHSSPVLSCSLSSSGLSAKIGEHRISTQYIQMEAKSLYRKNEEQILLKWNPMLNFAVNNAEVDIAGFEQHVSVPQIAFKYNNRDFDIISSNIILGNSDFALSGNIHHIGKWMADKAVLSGELNFTSNHTDVNQLLDLFSADAGSEETTTTTTTTTTTDEADPFLVPTNLDLTLNTNIRETEVFNQVAKNLGGKVYVRNGMVVLEEVGFICDAAKLQLTAIYRTPRRNHIYLGMDYHMMDIKIDQLISMIPQIDSMMPMLRSFKGEAEFHLAAETYLNANYDIKTSTLRGACSLFGKDLVVMDSETFDKISKTLMFKKKTENIVDSISAEITLYKDQVDIYPFCVSMDNYKVALGGRHKLDMSFDYHINLLSPVYLGVDVSGTMDNLSIKAAKCIYAKDFRPVVHNSVSTQNAQLRQLIRDSLRKNVKIQ